jgi:hypothetical protein
MKLTPKQEKFVQGLFSGLSQRKSYIEAGYSTNNKPDSYIDKEACLLAKNRKVIERLTELQDKVANDNLWSKERLIKEFEEVKKKCMQEVEVEVYDKELCEMVGTGEYVFKENGVIKSLENIGKLCGHYVEKVELSEKMPNIILKK